MCDLAFHVGSRDVEAHLRCEAKDLFHEPMGLQRSQAPRENRIARDEHTQRIEPFRRHSTHHITPNAPGESERMRQRQSKLPPALRCSTSADAAPSAAVRDP
jgi:hypothetical protein